MNRIEKKCFITMACAHGLLVVILFVGPAFFVSHEKADSSQPITVFSAADIAKVTGGGTPQDVRAIPLPPPPTPTVQQNPVVVTPTPPEIPKITKPEPKDLRTPTPDVKIKPSDKGDEPAPPPKKRVTKLNPDELVSSIPTADKIKKQKNADDQAKAKALAAADAKERAQTAKEFGNALKALKDNLSGSTEIKFQPGTGGGGAATVGYFDLIKSRFDNAWHPSPTLGDDTPTVTISFTVTRDGTVRGHISKRSGIASMDKSVQSALDTVTSVEPFPPSFKEQQITATLNFDIQGKRQ